MIGQPFPVFTTAAVFTARSAQLKLAAVALAFTAAACSPSAQGEAPKAGPAPIPVEVVAVAAESEAGSIRATAVLGYLREPALAFKVPGVIARITVDEGDRIQKGQRLAWLQPTEVQAGASETQASLATAERALERTKSLFDKGFVSQARLDDAQLAVDRARAARDAAGFARDTAILEAPADGVVLRRLAEPAQVAAAGAPILLVGDVRSGLVARAGLASGQAARVRLGDRARVRADDLGADLEGKVSRIAAKGDGATGAFDVEIALPATTGLRSGQIADVTIFARARATDAASALRAPTLSLLDARADQGVVFVVGADNVAKRRAVRTAGVDGDEVLIVAGLEPSERVVATGAAYVRDGDVVTVTAQK